MTSGRQATKHLRFELHGATLDVMPKVNSIAAFLLDAGCDTPSAQQVAIVAEEILTNIVRDAWPGREPGFCAVDVTATVQAAAIHVCLRAEDDGIAFNPMEASMPDLDASIDERSIGGLGIVLIKTMTDTQAYRRSGDRNIFEVCKVCPATPSG